MTDDPDPYGDLPYVERLPVLGVPTVFASDDAAVTAAIRAAYGHWRPYAVSDPAAPDDRADPVVRIAVRPGSRAHAGGTGPALRVTAPGRLVLRAAGVAGWADAARGVSIAVVAPSVVAQGDRFLDEVLEPLTLFLLGHRDRQPIHAAAIVRGDTAILLAGPSGAGKSTLTYAASRHGFSVLADEPVYVQLRPRLRVWGRRARLHLPPEARQLFPELMGIEPMRLPTGKTKLVIDAGEGPRSAERACLCVLRRDPDRVARLEPLATEAAVLALTASLDPGYDLFAATIGERVRRVAEGGAWSLAVSPDPRDALPLLHEVAAAMEPVP